MAASSSSSSSPATVRPAFRNPSARAEFFAAYHAVLRRWPLPVDALDVPSAYGRTRVHACGAVDGPPLVLLHGGAATSTVWFGNVGELGRTHRVYAVDQIGDAGCSVHDGQPIRGLGDFLAWLDALFDHLGLRAAALCGHSYGGWLALSYALHAPARVERLALLDPTDCFAAMTLSYRVRAVPLLAWPSAARMRTFLRWETGGAALDPEWLELAALAGGEVRSSKLVLPRRPSAEALRACTVPTLVVLAERSRSHDVRKVAANARRHLPDVVTAVLPGATHHTMPTVDPQQLNRAIDRFLG